DALSMLARAAEGSMRDALLGADGLLGDREADVLAGVALGEAVDEGAKTVSDKLNLLTDEK
ncbi:MAG: hypothetical protein ACPGYG_05770, partial [Candidatus Puniceispirillaceae bacterium]